MTLPKKLKKLLYEAGLTEAQTLIYIELLKKPAQTKWEIVNRTGLNKNSIYRSFPNLENFKMVSHDKDGYKACSLKALVSHLYTSGRKQRKLADKIKKVAPFLRIPYESIEEFDTLYTLDQICDAYLFMSETPYDTNLDFGDFENFVPTIGGLEIANKFRSNRVKHASHHAVCTTFGETTGYFCTNEAKTKFKNKVSLIESDEKDKFVIFSDNSDYVLFNYFGDEQCSVLVKSRPIAEIQRMQFDIFSHKLENV